MLLFWEERKKKKENKPTEPMLSALPIPPPVLDSNEVLPINPKLCSWHWQGI